MPCSPKLAALIAAATWVVTASAATVSVAVNDRNGKPLPEAVVMLEPLGAPLPVKPMLGVQVTQAKRQFNPRVTVVTVGTAVAFPNLDSVRHHVYSFSPIKAFELKLYAGVPREPVVFDKAGIAVLGCNIHDQMVAWIVVVDTPLHARSNELGQTQLSAVAPGAYRLRTWHPALGANVAPASQALDIGSSDIEQRVTLPMTID